MKKCTHYKRNRKLSGIIFTLLLLIGCGKLLMAGDTTKNRLRFNVSLGVSVPLRTFATCALADSTHRNGYAKAGYHFDLSLQYGISKRLGVIVSMGGNVNSFNSSAYSIDNNPLNSPYIATSVSGGYYTGEYMGGLFASYPVGAKFYIQFQVSVGLLTVNYPVTTISSTSQSVTYTYSTALMNATSMGYNGSVECMYKVSGRSAITLKLGYTGSNVTYPGYTSAFTETGFPTLPFSNSYNILMTLGIIEPTLGLSVGL